MLTFHIPSEDLVLVFKELSIVGVELDFEEWGPENILRAPKTLPGKPSDMPENQGRVYAVRLVGLDHARRVNHLPVILDDSTAMFLDDYLSTVKRKSRKKKGKASRAT